MSSVYLAITIGEHTNLFVFHGGYEAAFATMPELLEGLPAHATWELCSEPFEEYPLDAYMPVEAVEVLG